MLYQQLPSVGSDTLEVGGSTSQPSMTVTKRLKMRFPSFKAASISTLDQALERGHGFKQVTDANGCDQTHEHERKPYPPFSCTPKPVERNRSNNHHEPEYTRSALQNISGNKEDQNRIKPKQAPAVRPYQLEHHH